ncbi:MAG: ABC transporter permease, partial [Bacteroidota bacterium]
RNYLKIAFRSLWKDRMASTINVLGLALGLACCFCISIYIAHERSYDQFHPAVDRVFRVNYDVDLNGGIQHARVPPTIGPALAEYFPELDAVARMYPRDLSAKVVRTNQQLEIRNAFFGDSTILDILGFELLYGDARTALNEPFSVLLDETTARQLFGRTDVLGEQLQLAASDQFRVTGVFRDWPDQTHLDLGMLVRYENMVDVEPEHARELLSQVLERNWIATHSFTYVKLGPNATREQVQARMPKFVAERCSERFRDKQKFNLFPVQDIHLYSEVGGEPKPAANLNMLRLFMGIGVLTLLIAIFNFINLTTASSLSRAREVGMRKVLGARRPALLGQFLGESFLLTGLAFVVALALVALALPSLSTLTGVELRFSPLRDGTLLVLFTGVFLLTGLAAGSYPALFLSGFEPLKVLQGRGTEQKLGGVGLRKVLMTLQFAVAILFISGTAIVYLQLQFLREQPLGFQSEATISLPLSSENNINSVFRPGDATLRGRMNAFDEALAEHPNILAVTQTAERPGMGAISRNVWTDQIAQTDNYFTRTLAVDYDFIETFDIEVIAGREFDVSHGTDHTSSFVINESAVADMKWASPEAALGQRLVLEGKEGQVVGVVKDFHQNDLRAEMSPLILEVNPGSFDYFCVKTSTGDLTTTLTFLEDKWAEFFPAKTFEYSFLDETLRNQYESEERLGKLTRYFATLAIFISCFGLFGLAALLTKRRFREIGIRKVLGARVGQILTLLAKDFVGLIFVAMVIAIPICWYFLSTWMEDFPYRIDFPWWIPFTVGFGVLVIAFVTISSQTLRAATANPVDAIARD